jgi:hypothetical protein
MDLKKTSKTNEWGISDYEYAQWIICIPAPKNINNLYELLRFYKSFDVLSRNNKIYMIDEIEGEFKDSENFHYIDWIEQTFLQTQFLMTPGIGGYVGPTDNPKDSPRQTILTEICFYDENNNIQSQKINNIRRILQATYDYERCDITPIEIFGSSIGLERVLNDTYDVHIWINCKTDIWFPWIPHRKGGVYDNRELAHCHTSRLNNFLSGVKELVLDIGGTFEIDCTSSFYEKQLSQAGISLDCECPEWIPNPYSKY